MLQKKNRLSLKWGTISKCVALSALVTASSLEISSEIISLRSSKVNNLQNVAAIDINTIITNTNLGDVIEIPNSNLIFSFIYNQAQAKGYPDVVNDLEIEGGIIGNTHTTVKVAQGDVYTGQVTITYTIVSPTTPLDGFIPEGSVLSIPITDNLWNMDETQVLDLVRGRFSEQFTNANFNQILVDKINYQTDEALQTQIVNVTFKASQYASSYLPDSTTNVAFGIPLGENTYRYKTSDTWVQGTDSAPTIDLSGRGIAQFYSNLPNLTNLNISNNALSDFSFSHSDNLTTLNLANNQLTKINLGGFVNLTNLNIANNNLINVDISACKKLVNLDVSYNELTSIYLATNAELTTLDVSNNNLVQLDLVKNPKLGSLIVANNNSLTTIMLSIYDNSINMNNIIANISGLPTSGNRFVFCSYNTNLLPNYTSFSTRLSGAGFTVASPTKGNFIVTDSPTSSDITGKEIAYSTSSLQTKTYIKVMLAPFNNNTMLGNFMNNCGNLTDVDFRPLAGTANVASYAFRTSTKLNLDDLSFLSAVTSITSTRFFDSIYSTRQFILKQMPNLTSIVDTALSWASLNFVDFSNANTNFKTSGREVLSSPGANFSLINLGDLPDTNIQGYAYQSNYSFIGGNFINKWASGEMIGVVISGTGKNSNVDNFIASLNGGLGGSTKKAVSSRYKINEETQVDYFTKASNPTSLDFSTRNDITYFNALVPDCTSINFGNNPLSNLYLTNQYKINNVTIKGQPGKTLNLYMQNIRDGVQNFNSTDGYSYSNTIVHLSLRSGATVNGQVLGNISYVYDL